MAEAAVDELLREADHLRTGVIQTGAFQGGKWVICDRFLDSNACVSKRERAAFSLIC